MSTARHRAHKLDLLLFLRAFFQTSMVDTGGALGLGKLVQRTVLHAVNKTRQHTKEVTGQGLYPGQLELRPNHGHKYSWPWYLYILASLRESPIPGLITTAAEAHNDQHTANLTQRVQQQTSS